MGLTRLRRRAFVQIALAAAASGAMRGAAAAQPRHRLGNAKVVVVGGGFAGAGCALALRRLHAALDVTLVDPDDPYVTCPMSNSVLVGLRDAKSLRVPRHGLKAAGVRQARDRVATIDARGRRVRLAGGATLPYDRLVMAPGIRFLWGKPQGYDAAAPRLMPHAWIAGEQTELLATRLRAMRDGGVVAISVPPGPMRCPPGPFERASLIADYLWRNKPRSKVLIFDSNNHFPKQDAFTEAWQSLYPGMIEWISVVDGGAVLRVEPELGMLHTERGAHRVDVANIIPPQAPARLAAEAGLASDHGWCPIKAQTFESALADHVHVIGDACIADPMPKAASAAHAQARQCALAIVAALSGDPEPATAMLESVCYSMLNGERALSIHGRFELAGGAIQTLPAQAEAAAVSAEQEARNAAAWYAGIVTDSFGV
jgi:sulfide dehydrogenase [flavocytochrome c] flavoprotein subunit